MALSRTRRHRRHALNAEVNIINLVDVMLVLLIIFMVTAPIFQGGIAVNLPKAAVRPIPMTDALVITVERNGRITMGDEHQTWQQFQLAIAAAAAAQHPNGVFIKGDAGAPYGDVVRVLAAVKNAGIAKVGLVTEQSP